jgi:isopentenyl diphosphate isomerase/L-lactate dehydrogenase-like FMN-dependent dehydrogenase
MSQFLTLHEIAKAARTNLSRNHWDYLRGAAETETSMIRNRVGLDSLAFRPRVLNDVSAVNVQTKLLGRELRIPVVLAPLGSIQVFDSGGGASVAQACSTFGTMMTLSSVCTPDLETVAQSGSCPKIYQLYLVGDRGWMTEIVHRAIAAGYDGFCLTVDTQVYSRRERDIAKRFVPASGRQAGGTDFAYQAKMTWQLVEDFKRDFTIPLVLKGINVADDARRAIDTGVDVVWVSNHGGRQLDHGRACIDALPEVVDAVHGRVPVIVDGGFMRGTDIIKGLCLGANAVAIGRLEALAMAAGGAPAVARMLELLEAELKINMALLGVGRLADLNPSLVEKAPPVVNAHVLSAFPLIEDY